jgi:transcriptional regulator with XRE-family HTH domain
MTGRAALDNETATNARGMTRNSMAGDKERTLVSSNLARCIAASGLSQVEIARRANLGATTLSSYVRGRRQPSSIVLGRIASVLGVSVEMLIRGTTAADEAFIQRSAHLPGLSRDDSELLSLLAQGIRHWRQKMSGQRSMPSSSIGALVYSYSYLLPAIAEQFAFVMMETSLTHVEGGRELLVNISFDVADFPADAQAQLQRLIRTYTQRDVAVRVHSSSKQKTLTFTLPLSQNVR